MKSMKKVLIILVAGLLTAACSQNKSGNGSGDAETISVTMYKNEGCQCCTKWAEHLDANGYEVEEKPVDNLYAFKFNYKVPNDLHSCHTAIIDGYVVEGHVPVEDINRLLEERPDAKGLAVPGMPIGSPGMENPSYPDQPYDVLLFQENGSRTVYSSHGGEK